ncbi:MAG: hypothetical protein ACPGNT_05785 [Rhodospirillales bacterium]
MLSRLLPSRLAVRAVALLGLAFLVSACETTPQQTAHPQMSFAQMGTIGINVARIEVVNRYQPPLVPPHVDHLFPVTPTAALTQWAKDRLRATGSQGVARFIILDAGVKESELKKTEGIKGAFTVDQSERYDAGAEAMLEILDDAGISLKFTSARVTESRTIAEDATLNERETLWFSLTEDLVKGFDAAILQQFKSHLQGFVDPWAK